MRHVLRLWKQLARPKSGSQDQTHSSKAVRGEGGLLSRASYTCSSKLDRSEGEVETHSRNKPRGGGFVFLVLFCLVVCLEKFRKTGQR